MAKLKDKFGRVHDYLRLSLVDKCNLRCTYCMPENIRFLPKDRLMSREEIAKLVGIFVEDYGVKKIRLTGGEPLLRTDAAEILEDLGKLPVKLAMTTNGLLLDKFLDQFQRIGLRDLNFSLDTLKPDRFKEIARRDQFQATMDNLQAALDSGFRVKLNMVVMRGVNDDEILDFVALSKDKNLHIRFIEFMPFQGNQWEWERVLSFAEMMKMVEAEYEVEKLKDKPNSTSKAFRAKGHAGTFAVISSVTAPFCGSCNRIRLTAEGKMRNCLFAQQETDLLTPLRAGEDVRSLMEASIFSKHKKLGGLPDFQDTEALQAKLSERAMVKIGG